MSEALQKEQSLGQIAAEANEFSALLNKEFKPQTDRMRQDVESAVNVLARQALESSVVVSSDAVESIQAIIAQLDKKLSEQINQILHHEEFQKLEGAWRGLHYLVNNTETDTQLKIRVMNLSKKDLHKTLKRFKGAAWDQSPIFKKLYEEEYGQLGGEPFGCLVADYHFDQSAVDVETLGELAKTAAAAHAPIISGAAPSLFQMESW
jgi:type VI secretion system protein ImpC